VFYTIDIEEGANMTSFSQDRKWIEAKKLCGSAWVETVSYYRSIQGKNVFVYAILNKSKHLIVGAVSDDTVLLINRDKQAHLVSYSEVDRSRKLFKYSEDYEEETYEVDGTLYVVPLPKS
jgi:hypothetical protein